MIILQDSKVGAATPIRDPGLVIVAEANSGQRCTWLGGVIWSYVRIATVPFDKVLETLAVCRL